MEYGRFAEIFLSIWQLVARTCLWTIDSAEVIFRLDIMGLDSLVFSIKNGP